MNKFIGLIILFVFAISCDTGFNSEGTVIDKSTQLPIKNVKIDIKGKGTTYTDTKGQFKIDTMIYGYAGDLEILLEKDGYKTKHINFKIDKIEKKNAQIEMEKLEGLVGQSCMKKSRIAQLYHFNKYIISVFNALTLIFLTFNKKIRRRFLWILGILLLNLTVFISYTDCSLAGIQIINAPIHLTHYRIHPYSIKIVIPVISILFWGIYLIKKKIILKKSSA